MKVDAKVDIGVRYSLQVYLPLLVASYQVNAHVAIVHSHCQPKPSPCRNSNSLNSNSLNSNSLMANAGGALHLGEDAAASVQV